MAAAAAAAVGGMTTRPLWERKADVFLWLLRRWHVRPGACGYVVVRLSAENGHLHVCKWLATQPGVRFDPCGYWAAIFVQHGHLDMCRWLATQPGVHFNSRDNLAARLAAAHGHLEVCEWLATQPGVRFDTANNWAAHFAAKKGHLGMCEWLATQPGVRFDSHDNFVARNAAVNGRLDVLQWLATQPGVRFDAHDNLAARCAAGRGQLDMCKWLATQPGVSFLGVFMVHQSVGLWFHRQKAREKSASQRVLFASWNVWRAAPHRSPCDVVGNREFRVFRNLPRAGVAELLMQLSPVM